MLFYIGVIAAVIFRDARRGLFFGRLTDEILMSPFPHEAMDIALQHTDPLSISSILSLGTKALAIEESSSKIVLQDINFNDRKQFFKAILTPDGTYILQHADRCVGYSPNFEHRLHNSTDKNGYLFAEMVECSDTLNIIGFLISDKIDGELLDNIPSLVGGLSETFGSSDPNNKKLIVQTTISEKTTGAPKNVGFLRSLGGESHHLF